LRGFLSLADGDGERPVKHVDEPLDAVAVSDADALFDAFLRRILVADRLRRLLAEHQGDGDVRLLDHRDLGVLGVRYSKRHLHSMWHAGVFPVPLLMGAKLVWRSDEIQLWIARLPRADAVPRGSNKPAQRTLRRGRQRANGHKLEAESARPGTDQTQA
jgi:hypothetical protein